MQTRLAYHAVRDKSRAVGCGLRAGQDQQVSRATFEFYRMTVLTCTHKQIYRRTQTLNPPLRIGAPGN